MNRHLLQISAWATSSLLLAYGLGWSSKAVILVSILGPFYLILIRLANRKSNHFAWLVRIAFLPVWPALAFMSAMSFMVLPSLVEIFQPAKILAMALVVLFGAIASCFWRRRLSEFAFLPLLAGLCLLGSQSRAMLNSRHPPDPKEAISIAYAQGSLPILIPGTFGSLPEGLGVPSVDPFRRIAVVGGYYLMITANSKRESGGLLRLDLREKSASGYPIQALSSCGLLNLLAIDENHVLCTGYKCKKILLASIEPLKWEKWTDLGIEHPEVIAWAEPGKSLVVLCENATFVILTWPELRVAERKRLPIWAMPAGSGASLVTDPNRRLWLAGSDIMPPGMIVCTPFLRPLYIFNLPLGRSLAIDAKSGLAYMADSILGKIIEVDPAAGKILRRFPSSRGIGIGGLDPTRNLLMASNYFSGEVEFFDLATGRITGKVKTGKRVRQVITDKLTGRTFAVSEIGVQELLIDKIISRARGHNVK